MTKKQKRFVEEYLIDLNATQAAIRSGYSPDTAGSIGYENMRKPEIRACIDKAMAARSKRTGVNQDRVVRELAKLAFVNIKNVIDPDSVEIRKDATDEDLSCIQSVKIKPTEFGLEREVKLFDKKAALVDLGRHLGMFTDRVDVNGDMELNITIDYGDEDAGPHTDE